MMLPIHTEARYDSDKVSGSMEWLQDDWRLRMTVATFDSVDVELYYDGVDSEAGLDRYGRTMPYLLVDNRTAALMLCLHIVNRINQHGLRSDQMVWWWQRFVKTLPDEPCVSAADVAKLYGRVSLEIQTQEA